MLLNIRTGLPYVGALVAVPVTWAFAAAACAKRARAFAVEDVSFWVNLSDGLVLAWIVAWLGVILVSGRFRGGWRRGHDLPALVAVPPVVMYVGLRYFFATL